jgi:hypothetical protein
MIDRRLDTPLARANHRLDQLQKLGDFAYGRRDKVEMRALSREIDAQLARIAEIEETQQRGNA